MRSLRYLLKNNSSAVAAFLISFYEGFDFFLLWMLLSFLTLPTLGRDQRQEALHTSQVHCRPQETEAGWEFREGESGAKRQGKPSQSEL